MGPTLTSSHPASVLLSGSTEHHICSYCSRLPASPSPSVLRVVGPLSPTARFPGCGLASCGAGPSVTPGPRSPVASHPQPEDRGGSQLRVMVPALYDHALGELRPGPSAPALAGSHLWSPQPGPPLPLGLQPQEVFQTSGNLQEQGEGTESLPCCPPLAPCALMGGPGNLFLGPGDETHARWT